MPSYASVAEKTHDSDKNIDIQKLLSDKLMKLIDNAIQKIVVNIMELMKSSLNDNSLLKQLVNLNSNLI